MLMDDSAMMMPRTILSSFFCASFSAATAYMIAL